MQKPTIHLELYKYSQIIIVPFLQKGCNFSMNSKINPIVIRQGMNIGKVAAEADDNYLFNCFLKTYAYEELVDPNSPAMIISGRTGSGKTALLRYIEETEEACHSIDPFEMSMTYVANSDILSFLNDIGADLDLLFQLLWKHVLCLEFIRMRFSVEDEHASKSLFDRLTDIFQNNSHRKEAISYLEQYRNSFWVEMDKNVLELLETYEKKFVAELGGEIKKISAGINYAKQVSKTKRENIVSRVKKIINGEQHAQLSKVMGLLKDPLVNDKMRCHFILLDQLDQNWVDDSIRFQLIGALIEALKKFRPIPNLKIIIALRTDVIERVAMETQHVGSQREKMDDYSIRLQWNKEELRELIERRIALLFKRKYTTENVLFSELFPRKINDKDPFDYILKRTHMRPRDVLSFVNECLRQTQGKSEISAQNIKDSEKEYSRVRYQALCQEWSSTYPSLPIIIETISHAIHGKKFKDISVPDVWELLVLRILEEKGVDWDKSWQIANKAAQESSSSQIQIFARETLALLYRVGVISLKSMSDDYHKYSDKASPIINPSSIENETMVRLHPMLEREFGAKPEDLAT